MSQEPQLPWYRRPLPGWLPAWLVLALGLAATGGFLATYKHQYTVLTVVAGCVIGFLFGVYFSIAVTARLGASQAADTSHFRPPAWLTLPVTTGMFCFFAYCMIDETLRQGYYDTYLRHRSYIRIPGPLAFFISVCLLCVAGFASGQGIWHKPRQASPVAGALLGFAVIVFAVYAIAMRIVAYYQ